MTIHYENPETIIIGVAPPSTKYRYKKVVPSRDYCPIHTGTGILTIIGFLQNIFCTD